MEPNRTSEAIKLLRFPLIILVIFIHYPDNVNFLGKDIASFSDCIKYTTIAIAYQAVPTFFFISGFLFFYNKSNINNDFFIRQIRKRIKSLLIPYLILNTLFYVIPLTLKLCACLFLYKPYEELYSLFNLYYTSNFLHIYGINSSPAIAPLWYIRDLFIITLLSPLLYRFFYKFKIYSCIILCILMYIPYTSNLIINTSSVFFFSLGSLLSINNKNFEVIYKHKNIILSLFAISYILCFIIAGYPFIYRITTIIFRISGLFCLVILAYKLCDKKSTACFKYLSCTTFFVYCIHTFPIPFHTPLDFSCILTNNIKEYFPLAVFFMRPFVCFFLCAIIYLIVNKLRKIVTFIDYIFHYHK